MYKNAVRYFKEHIVFHGLVHFLGGLGLGIILAEPLFSPHLVIWGLLFIVLALLGHIYALKAKR